jgi:hypothetical protein
MPEMTVVLPASVQRQMDQMADFDRALEGSTEPPAPNELPADPPAAPVVSTPPQPPAAPVQGDQAQYWHQSYMTLQGKYNAEIGPLHAEVSRLSGQLAQAMTKLAEYAEKRQTTEPTAPQGRLVTDKDVESFGGDLVDFVKRAATDVVGVREAELSREIEMLRNENAELKGRVGNVAEQQSGTARQIYLQHLASKVPDWELLNKDMGFLRWLAEIDQLSGHPRQAYLNAAFQAHNVEQTATIFNAYKALVAPPAPTRGVTPQQELARQQAPRSSGNASASPTAATPADKIFTTREIERFYSEASRGGFKGREQERLDIEAQIDRAVAEGRVRPG